MGVTGGTGGGKGGGPDKAALEYDSLSDPEEHPETLSKTLLKVHHNNLNFSGGGVGSATPLEKEILTPLVFRLRFPLSAQDRDVNDFTENPHLELELGFPVKSSQNHPLPRLENLNI